LNWFKEFPEFKQNDLYITGESYGGIYVPYLAYRLHTHNQTTQTGGDIKLKGIAVGNGVTDWTVDCDPAYIELSWYHGLIPKDLQKKIESTTCDFSEVAKDPLTKECQEIYNEWSKYTKNINVYDIYKSPEDGGLMSDFSVEKYLKGEEKVGYTPFLKNHRISQPFTSEVTHYLDRQDVREIFHVTEKKGSFQP
jgi:carboxypeptidase C (cathepsin A)